MGDFLMGGMARMGRTGRMSGCSARRGMWFGRLQVALRCVLLNVKNAERKDLGMAEGDGGSRPSAMEGMY